MDIFFIGWKRCARVHSGNQVSALRLLRFCADRAAFIGTTRNNRVGPLSRAANPLTCFGLVHLRYFADFDATPEFLEERSCVHPEVSAMIIAHPVTETEQVRVRHLLWPDFLCLLHSRPKSAWFQITAGCLAFVICMERPRGFEPRPVRWFRTVTICFPFLWPRDEHARLRQGIYRMEQREGHQRQNVNLWISASKSVINVYGELLAECAYNALGRARDI